MSGLFEVCVRFFFVFSEQFTEIQIVANAFVMFGAGFETVSTALSFCLYELALKKHIQDRVRSDIASKISKHNGEINNEFLLDLNYLDMVLAGIFSFRRLTSIVENKEFYYYYNFHFF